MVLTCSPFLENIPHAFEVEQYAYKMTEKKILAHKAK